MTLHEEHILACKRIIKHKSCFDLCVFCGNEDDEVKLFDRGLGEVECPGHTDETTPDWECCLNVKSAKKWLEVNAKGDGKDGE